MQTQTVFDASPKVRAKKAFLCAGICFVCAVTAWSASSLPDVPLPAVWQLVAVCFLTAMVVIFARYVAHRHNCTLYFDDDRYEDLQTGVDGDVADVPEPGDALSNGDLWSFKVTETQNNKRRMVVCHLSGKDILCYCNVTDDASRTAAKKSAAHLKVYNFCDDMAPAVFSQFLMQNGDEVLCVRFSPDDAMRDAMTRLYGNRTYNSQKENCAE